MEELIRSAKTDFPVSDEFVRRVATAIESAPVTARTRSRRRLVAVAAGVVVVLVGLGFVPVPMGSSRGALGRAIAAFDSTTGLYVRGRELRHRDIGDRVTEDWEAPGGLRRMAYWDDGKLESWQVEGADFAAFCNPDHRWADVYELPHAEADQSFSWTLGRVGQMLEFRREQTRTTQLNEWRERSLWGGETDVIEAAEPLEDPEQGWRKMRWEVDATTGRVTSEKHWWRPKGGQWQLVAYTEEVAWDVDLPSNTWVFIPPRGWKVRYHHWWRQRVENALASGETRDWRVTVHTIDASKEGDLFVTLSRLAVAEIGRDSRTAPIRLTAVDSLGVVYEPENDVIAPTSPDRGRQYRVIVLKREQSRIPPGIARTVTLTVQPAGDELHADEVLTFVVPLPPLQGKVDLDETEVVQY
jgi:hypothetical protein